MNGDNLLGADHYDAVDVLKTAGNNIVMVLGREKIPKDVRIWFYPVQMFIWW